MFLKSKQKTEINVPHKVFEVGKIVHELEPKKNEYLARAGEQNIT